MLNSIVSIFVNGNKEIGYGHISRCLIIARELFKNKFNVKFIVPDNCSFKDKIEIEFNVQIIKDFSKVELKKIKKKSNEIALIDVTELEFNNFKILKEKKIFDKIISITLFDFNHSSRFEDVSFYPSYELSQDITIKTDFGDLIQYIGKKYLVFNSQDLNISDSTNNHKVDILISMGGADPESFTLKVLESLKNEQLSITVILNNKALSYNSVKDFCSKKENIHLIDFIENLPSIFSKHKLLIINGGITRYETILNRVPFIAISLHKLQFSITEKVTRMGVGLNLGVGKDLSHFEIRKSILETLANDKRMDEMFYASENLLDNKAPERIVKIIKRINEKNNIF